MSHLPLNVGSILLLMSVGVALSLVPFTQKITVHHSKPDFRDPLQGLLTNEWSYCKDRPARFPACREWRLRTRLEDPVRTFQDKTYTIPVTIGNPAEVFDVVLDTGSEVFWVTSPQCTEGGCETRSEMKHPRKKWNYTTSSSFHTNHVPFNKTYGGGEVVGFLGTDDFRVGPLSIGGQDLLLALNMSLSFQNVSCDGLVGLAYPRRSQSVPRSVLENLSEEIQLFSIYLHRNPHTTLTDGGSIVWGSLDPQHCKPDVKFVPLVNLDTDANPFNLWEVALDEIRFDGVTYGEGEEWVAAVDTGASTIRGPYDPFNYFIEEKNKGVRNETDGVYYAPCETKFASFSLVIGNQEFVIEPEQFVFKIPGYSQCQLALGLQEGKKTEPEFLVGQPFLRTKCLIFDISQARMGFANHLEH